MPPRPPTLIPKFTEAQLAEARRMVAKATAPQRSVRRARLALVLAAAPQLQHAEAAAQAGVSLQMVRKWRRRWSEVGWSLEDAPRSGRPPVFSPAGRDPGQSSGV